MILLNRETIINQNFWKKRFPFLWRKLAQLNNYDNVIVPLRVTWSSVNLDTLLSVKWNESEWMGVSTRVILWPFSFEPECCCLDISQHQHTIFIQCQKSFAVFLFHFFLLCAFPVTVFLFFEERQHKNIHEKYRVSYGRVIFSVHRRKKKKSFCI